MNSKKQQFNIGDIVHLCYIDWDESYIEKKAIITKKYLEITGDEYFYSLFVFENRKIVKNVCQDMLYHDKDKPPPDKLIRELYDGLYE
jgi:hypothetical protein